MTKICREMLLCNSKNSVIFWKRHFEKKKKKKRNLVSLSRHKLRYYLKSPITKKPNHNTRWNANTSRTEEETTRQTDAIESRPNITILPFANKNIPTDSLTLLPLPSPLPFPFPLPYRNKRRLATIIVKSQSGNAINPGDIFVPGSSVLSHRTERERDREIELSLIRSQLALVHLVFRSRS